MSDSLELQGCLKALEMASSDKRMEIATIHHSDRGIQYCSHRYVNQLASKGIKVSMGEAGNCYENAMAERVNGILKNEFNLDYMFANLEQARKATKQAIRIYNEKRPHMAIDMRKPAELYAA